jgi:hypothetical protein
MRPPLSPGVRASRLTARFPAHRAGALLTATYVFRVSYHAFTPSEPPTCAKNSANGLYVSPGFAAVLPIFLLRYRATLGPGAPMPPILPVLAGLGKITDRLMELVKYREEKSRRIFDKLIEPIFNDLLLIHKDYLEMFEEVRKMLPDDKGGRKKTEKKLTRAYEYLESQRRAFEPTREKLRATVRELPKKVEKDNKKEAFVRSIADYLLWTRISPGMGSVSTVLAREIRAAAIRYSYPPSKAQSDEIRDKILKAARIPDRALNAEELAAYVSSILDRLRQRFACAAEAYAAILVKVRNE